MVELKKMLLLVKVLAVVSGVSGLANAGFIIYHWSKLSEGIHCLQNKAEVRDMAEPDLKLESVVEPGLIMNSPGTRIKGDTSGNRIINSPGAVITNKTKWGKFTTTEDGTVRDVPPPWEHK